VIKLNKILCAIDFSKYSAQVIRYGSGMASQFRARLLIFHTVCIAGDPFYGAPAAEHSAKHEKMAQQARERIEKLMEGYPGEWEPVITFGEPVEEIERVVREQTPELVISASYGLTGLKRILIGTVVERMARVLTCPFLVLRSAEKKSNTEVPFAFTRIVLGCDVPSDSHSPPSTLRYALKLAQEFHAELHLLNTIESPADEELMDASPAPYAELQQMLQNRLHRRMTDLVSKEAAESQVKIAVLPGVPGEQLCSYAKEKGADMIIVGVRPRGALEKVLIGSTTEAVLRNAPCPVLVVSGEKSVTNCD
jgi:nucleotide-binding universal stress UspA family protein